ncbi:MAG: hypothetical protein LBU06_01630 [Desulfovibrio sp.]|nr:hypothetical protein [Desulfovibrio sp.]
MFGILVENPVIRISGKTFTGDAILLPRTRNARGTENAHPADPRDYFTLSGESGLFSLSNPEEEQAKAYAEAGRVSSRAGEARDFARTFIEGRAGLVPEKNLREAELEGEDAISPQDAPHEAKNTGESVAEAGKPKAEAEQNSDKTERSEQEKTGGVTNLDEAEKRELEELKARDREVRAHEQAHAATGGSFAGSPTYRMQTGPDGRRYAVGGEVAIDVSAEATPEATIAKARKIRAAALAPAEPSGADRAIAAKAARLEAEAARENMSRKGAANESGEPGKNDQAEAAGVLANIAPEERPETPGTGAAAPEKLKAEARFGTADADRIRKAAQAYARVSGALAPIAPEFARPLSLAV